MKREYFNVSLYVIISFQIRRMQDMLSQMQEKLKATSRSSNSIYSDSQTPTEYDCRKKDGIINV